MAYNLIVLGLVAYLTVFVASFPLETRPSRENELVERSNHVARRWLPVSAIVPREHGLDPVHQLIARQATNQGKGQNLAGQNKGSNTAQRGNTAQGQNLAGQNKGSNTAQGGNNAQGTNTAQGGQSKYYSATSNQ